ncbi:MAG: phosphate ABC transporter permease PstA [Wenzhouxiangella sp.]|nr:MAG: phosphate ABC transporter permease PstA [Wenzhouxiangella sp.]
MRQWFKSGDPWIWLIGGAVSISLIMVIGLLLLIAVRGLGHFWQPPIVETTFHDEGQEIVVLGTIRSAETVTAQAVREAGFEVPEEQDFVDRYLFHIGNRDLTGRDFQWFVGDFLEEFRYPEDAIMLERREWGNFFGYLVAVKQGDEVIAEGQEAFDVLPELLDRSNELVAGTVRLERYDIGRINFAIERERLEQRRVELDDSLSAEEKADRIAASEAEVARLNAEYDELFRELEQLRASARRDSLVARTSDGREVTINLGEVVRATRANTMSVPDKIGEYVARFWSFMSGYPREANTEGGIFPAIFGTVMMVFIMSIVVTPFGVLAAIYLREYAKQGPVTRVVRISVNNLAGVPSIVFGVFGLGFFIYFLGGNIDQLFFPERLPAPTFGSPGLIWASLTLALLTLPVVIVSTEEGLTRIPKAMREGSLALGATKAETLWKVIVPVSTPAMMTGLILAVARAAGEVAPLMLVGVVKLAPNLPVDGQFPFIHLERRIMHLGFHIYDVGFQSPNAEAARPLVYATALVLVGLILVLNLTAIAVRNRLRERYKSESD